MSEKKHEKLLSEQLRDLDELIAWFDQDNFDLDEALKKFDDGMKLSGEIEERLNKLENKITVLRQRFGEGVEKPA
jgi:exodeoxyribonuclease VII small subunit